jgi:hypothetical protein
MDAIQKGISIRLVLNWKRGKKTIPNQPSSNVPVFYTASSSLRYRAFAQPLRQWGLLSSVKNNSSNIPVDAT